MAKIKVIAKNKRGEKALRQHISETLKMNRLKKSMLKRMGYNQDVTAGDPLTLEIWSKPGSPFDLAKPEHIAEEIEEALKLNGARVGDFVIQHDRRKER